MVTDISPASLTGFTLDMNSTQLILTFNDVVLSDTLVVTSISIQGAGGEQYRLTEGDVLSTDGYEMAIQLSQHDTDQLRIDPRLATSLDNTFIGTEIDYLRDFANLGVIAVDQFQATTFIRDQIPPVLLNYTLNINEGLLTLYVNEILDLESFQPSGFILQSAVNSSGDAYALTGGVAQFATPPESYIVEISLSEEDINGLKMTVGVATDLTNTYLSLTDGAISDPGNNSIIPIPTSQALPAAGLEADMVRPVLRTVVLDLQQGALIFNFSEAVNTTGFLSLVELHNGAGFVADLSNAQLIVPAGSSLVLVQPSDEELNSIKLNPGIGNNQTDTYFTIQRNQISDFVNLGLVTTVSNRPVDQVIRDTVGPVIAMSTFDLNTGLLALVFNEYANITSTLNLGALTINNAVSGAALANLSDAATNTTVDGRDLFVFLSAEDLDAINSDQTLQSIALGVSTGLVSDFLGNESPSYTVLVDSIITDNQPPVLESFSIDMNTGDLVLFFSETLLTDNFTLSAITLHGSATDVADGYTLLNGSFAVQGSTITATLSEDELNAVKALASVGLNETTSYLSLAAGYVRDLRGNVLLDVATAMASLVTRDTESPTLLSFSFTYTRGDKAPVALVLVFNETIDVSSLQFDQTVFHQFSNGSGQQFTLSTSTLPQQNAQTVYIILSNEDLRRLGDAAPIAQEETATFLSVTGSSVSDTSSNPVISVTLPVTPPLVSLTPPSLTNYTVNVVEGTISFVFSEPVNASTFDITKFTLQDSATATINRYTFRFQGTLTTISDTELLFEADPADINGIKGVPNVATSLDFTYTSLVEGLIEDLDGHAAFAIPISSALQAGDVVPETAAPSLLYFSVDFNPGRPITLVFSETIIASTLRLDQFTLQDRPSSPVHTVNFSTAEPITANSDIIEVFLPLVVRDQILATNNFADSRTNTYLTWPTGAAQDRDGNSIEGSTLQAFSVAVDTTPPSITRVALNLVTRLFEVTFDESVISSTISLGGLAFQNSAENATVNYTLAANYSITGGDVSVFRLFLEDADLNAIKALDLCESSADCYLSYAAESFRDSRTIGTAGSVIQIVDFTQDSMRPEFVAFTSINLTAEELIVEFSEPINASSFIPTAFSLRTLFSEESLSNFTLTGGAAVSQGNMLVISLLEEDAIAIVKDPNLCTWRGNCYISIAEGAVKDPADLPLLPVVGMVTAIVQDFIEDTIPPSLVSFTLDVNAGLLSLTFSEPVDPTSLNPTGITLQDAANASESYTLNATASTRSPRGLEIDITLSATDLNLLKVTTFVSRSRMAYISLNPTTIADLALIPNYVTEIPMVSALRGTLISDTVRPQLTSFVLDLDSDSLVLSFNEPINVPEVDFTAFTIGTPTLSRPLQGGLVINSQVAATHILAVQLSSYDVVALKADSGISASPAATTLAFTSSAASDAAGNPIQPRLAGLVISVLIPDTSRVQLTAFTLDMVEGVLNLTFSDVVDPATFNPLAIVLQSSIQRYVHTYTYIHTYMVIDHV